MKGKIIELRSLLRKVESLAIELGEEAKDESRRHEVKLKEMQSNGLSFRESIPTFKKMNYYDRISAASRRLANSAEFDRITNQLFHKYNQREDMTHYELERKIKDVNMQISFYKKNFAPTDQHGMISVKDILSNLRYKKKKLQEQYAEAKYEYDCFEAELHATHEIFKKYNNDIYPSDIGQDWRWGVYDGILLMRIDDKLFSVAVKYPEKK